MKVGKSIKKISHDKRNKKLKDFKRSLELALQFKTLGVEVYLCYSKKFDQCLVLGKKEFNRFKIYFGDHDLKKLFHFKK